MTIALATLLALSVAGTQAASVVPIPPAERGLASVIADAPVIVPDTAEDLEGAVFLSNGDLLFCDVQAGRVLRKDAAGRITQVIRLDGLNPGGMALSPGGEVYIAAANRTGGGAVVAMRPDGSGLRTVVPESAGLAPNDLVFDAKGGFYVTDAHGTIGKPSGGVWYVAPGGAKPVAVVEGLAVGNGIALSPDGKTLWIVEYAAGRLYRAELKDAATLAPFGATVAYQFIGPAPDTVRVDKDGTVYVAINGQGRILIFTPSGLPAGQILLPGRDAGRDLHLTSMAIRPGSREMAIVTSDGGPGGRATIFHARTITR